MSVTDPFLLNTIHFRATWLCHEEVVSQESQVNSPDCKNIVNAKINTAASKVLIFVQRSSWGRSCNKISLIIGVYSQSDEVFRYNLITP